MKFVKSNQRATLKNKHLGEFAQLQQHAVQVFGE